MASLYEQFMSELKAADSQFSEYLEGGFIPDDKDYVQDAHVAVESLLELSQKVADEGRITRDTAQNMVKGLVFVNKLAESIGDGDSVKLCSFLTAELNDFTDLSKSQIHIPGF